MDAESPQAYNHNLLVLLWANERVYFFTPQWTISTATTSDSTRRRKTWRRTRRRLTGLGRSFPSAPCSSSGRRTRKSGLKVYKTLTIRIISPCTAVMVRYIIPRNYRSLIWNAFLVVTEETSVILISPGNPKIASVLCEMLCVSGCGTRIDNIDRGRKDDEQYHVSTPLAAGSGNQEVPLVPRDEWYDAHESQADQRCAWFSRENKKLSSFYEKLAKWLLRVLWTPHTACPPQLCRAVRQEPRWSRQLPTIFLLHYWASDGFFFMAENNV